MILPSLTFIATAEVAVHLGAKPVFVDVDEETLCLNQECVSASITPRTRLVVPVHHGGQLCDMEGLEAIATRHGVAIVEDAAHALSARHGQRRPGANTLGAAFSFYATKELVLGEGGALATDDPDVAEKCRSWSLHGMTKTSVDRARPGRAALYDVVDIGYKMNLPDALAALGVGQVARLEDAREAREGLARRYDEGFRGLDGIQPVEVRENHVSARHLYVVRVAPRIDRDLLAVKLERRGIRTSVHFVPLHETTVFREHFGYRSEDCPITSRLGKEILSLPLYPDLGFENVDRIVGEIREIVEGGVS